MTTYKLTTLASFADVELAWTDHSMQLLAIHHDDDMDELVTYDDYLKMRKEDKALFGKTVHIEHVNDLGWDSVEAYCNENKEEDDENVPSGPEVEQFTKYRRFNTVEELYLGVDPAEWWSFKNRFAQYAAVAEKAGKKAPLIQVKHVDKADGGVNGGFVVCTIDELEKAFHYCPYNSVVSIGYYEPYAIDD